MCATRYKQAQVAKVECGNLTSEMLPIVSMTGCWSPTPSY